MTDLQQHTWRKVRVLWPLGILFFSLILLQSARIVSGVNRVADNGRRLQTKLQSSGLALLQSSDSEDLVVLLRHTGQSVRDLRETIGPFVHLAPLFGWLPRYGGDLANATALLDYGEGIVNSGQATITLVRSLDSAMESGRAVGTPAGVTILRVAEEQAPMVQEVQRQLSRTRQARSRMTVSRLSPSLQETVNRIDRFLPLWTGAVDGLEMAPMFLGADRPRVYLLLAQNSDELRAGGGFISGVALVKTDRGEISVSDFQDTYALDNLTQVHPEAPVGLRYMFATMWVFRDANWSPDFPTAARAAELLYSIDKNVSVDGVIAVNLRILPRFLDVLGPVTLDTAEQPVTAANVVSQIQAYWASPEGKGHTDDWWSHRKDFMGRLLGGIAQRLLTGNMERVDLSRALYEAVIAKDLLIYSNEIPDSQQVRLPWSGSLSNDSNDTLMIVDSNVGFNKVDANIRRQAEYNVTIDGLGALRATVTMTYTNLSPATTDDCIHRPYYPPNYSDLQQGCYWNYVRVVAPTGSKLLDATSDLDAFTEYSPEPNAVFGGYFVLRRSESRTIHFSYRLPALKDQSVYSLRLQKQPGVAPYPIWVRVNLPMGWSSATNPFPTRSKGNALEFVTLLERDQQIEIALDRGLPLWAGLCGTAVFLSAGAWFTRRRRLAKDRLPS